MSLATNISNLATRIGTEFKSVYAKIGTLSSLTTTAKTDLVSAINEVNAKPSGSGGASINDAASGSTTTYSSDKINSLDTATLNSAKSYTDTAVGAKPSINDTTASTTTVYSSSKTDGQISTAVSNLVASAPGTLDTLNELATALGDDANFATTTSTALGNRLRFDAAQTLNGTQQTQGQSNLGVTASSAIGDTTTDYVAAFNAALL